MNAETFHGTELKMQSLWPFYKRKIYGIVFWPINALRFIVRIGSHSFLVSDARASCGRIHIRSKENSTIAMEGQVLGFNGENNGTAAPNMAAKMSKDNDEG